MHIYIYIHKYIHTYIYIYIYIHIICIDLYDTYSAYDGSSQYLAYLYDLIDVKHARYECCKGDTCTRTYLEMYVYIIYIYIYNMRILPRHLRTVRPYMCTEIYIYIYIYIYERIYIYIYTYVYVYTHIYIYRYVYIHIYDVHSCVHV